MLGRFLEISIHAPAIQTSLAFYESLGFLQASTGEAWPHPYAVVTDGRLFLGLHGAPRPSPALSFVLPRLAQGIERLEQLGVEFDERCLGDEVFNRVLFHDPTGQAVNLLEARTFSPPPVDARVATACGYFSELGIPVRDTATARAFWEPLGFVALEEQLQPFPRTALTSDHVDLALYRTRAFRQPVLTFEDSDMSARLARLRERGFEVSDEMPDSLEASANGVLIAPEGTRLLLLDSEE